MSSLKHVQNFNAWQSNKRLTCYKGGFCSQRAKRYDKKDPNYASSFRYQLIYFHYIVHVLPQLSITHSQFFLSFPAVYKLSIYNVISWTIYKFCISGYRWQYWQNSCCRWQPVHLLDITWRSEPGCSLEVSMSMNQSWSTDEHTKMENHLDLNRATYVQICCNASTLETF